MQRVIPRAFGHRPESTTTARDTSWGFPNAATPEGSEAYYAVRFAPSARRDRLAVAFAWRAEVAHLIEKAIDPGVARLKLDWWREELAAAQRGAARHPLAAGLAPWLGEWRDFVPWHEMLEGAETAILKRQPADENAFVQHCERLGGAFGEILAHAGGRPAAADIELARACGRYHEAVVQVRDLAPALARQHCPIPSTSLRRAGLTPDRLHDPRQRDRLGTCLAESLAAVGEPKAELGADHAAAPAGRLAAQAAALHRAMERRGYPVLSERVDISPLRRLWTAWRLGLPPRRRYAVRTRRQG